MRDWTDILVSECDARPEVLSKSIAEIAEAEGKGPLGAAFDLIVVSEGQIGCVWFDQSVENVRTLMRHPMVVAGSDGLSMSPHGVLG